MKKYFCLIAFQTTILFVSTNIWAFSDIDTHPKITKAAAAQSTLTTYLNDNLGYKNGLNEIILDAKIEQILMDGAQTEDSGILDPSAFSSCDRGLNHFYNPSKFVTDHYAGLDDVTSADANNLISIWPFSYHWTGKSNPFWAIGPDYSCSSTLVDPPRDKSSTCNDYSWYHARMAFLEALTAKTEDDRNKLFVRAFRSVGQIIHLLQDMAVPAHVRNDMKGHILA
jgi:hypothetical protein